MVSVASTAYGGGFSKPSIIIGTYFAMIYAIDSDDEKCKKMCLVSYSIEKQLWYSSLFRCGNFESKWTSVIARVLVSAVDATFGTTE